jgi:3D-(3,5/4)-trihydroxycyclohexane-1,2-dione acylhydrolase (decyclizing)
VIPVDREQRVGGYESWWDVPVAEVSTIDAVRAARAEYIRAKAAERTYL